MENYIRIIAAVRGFFLTTRALLVALIELGLVRAARRAKGS